jgi:hypothetical protein
MVLAESKEAAVKRVEKSFERDNVYAPGLKGPLAVLEDSEHFGTSNAREEALALYDKACEKAAKRTAKQGGAPPDPETSKITKGRQGNSREDTARASPHAEQELGVSRHL